MLNRIIAISLVAATSLALTSQSQASLVLESYASGTPTPTTIGGYAMQDFSFDYTIGAPAKNSVASPTSLGGNVSFINTIANTSTDLDHSSANNASSSWWNNGEIFDYDIYTTDLHRVTFMLPEYTRAFSFNVGADLGSTGNNAWLTASESAGSGIAKTWFNVSRSNTPGFAVYADSSQACSYVTEVTIDPLLWGFGNFSINQESCDIPEPSILALLGLGVFGIGLARRKPLVISK